MGAIDDGIVAVTDAGSPLIAWWERALAEGWVAGREELPLLDIAAAEFPNVLVEDPAHGCARWNLDAPGRGVTLARTLRLGEFDPDQPHLLAARPGEAPRVLLSEHPDLAEICREHADSLRRLGYADLPYGLDRARLRLAARRTSCAPSTATP